MLRPRVLLPIGLLAILAYAAYQRTQPLQVEVTPAAAGQVVNVVYAVGVVRPDTETQVAAEVAGRIVALEADEGDLVRPGQRIALLDDAEARIRLREAERRVDAARARLRTARAVADPLEVDRLSAQVGAAEARTRGAESRVAAARTAAATARAAEEAAAAAIEGARARTRSARSALTAAEGEVEAAVERVVGAEADVAQYRASVEGGQDLLQRRERLFRDGAIAERLVREARTALEQAEAGLRGARSRVESAKRGIQIARAQAEAARGQVEDAAAALETAAANHRAAAARVQEALNAVPELERQVEAAAREAEALRAQLARLRRGPRPVELEPQESEIRTLEEAVRQAREHLSRYTIRAPVGGRVTSRPVDPGDFLPSGGRVMTVADESRVYVQADVDEADIGVVRTGAEAHFQVDAMPGRSFRGRVTRIGRAADRGSRTYPVDVGALDSRAGLRIGMTADVNIRGRTDRQAVMVPPTALQTEKDTVVTWVVDSSGRVSRRPVRIRARDAGAVQVVAGLAIGEKVVLRPPTGLSDGRHVEVRR